MAIEMKQMMTIGMMGIMETMKMRMKVIEIGMMGIMEMMKMRMKVIEM
jgi:hypothetical protein